MMVLEAKINPFEAAADERQDEIVEIPDEHIPYLEDNIYPTLLQGMERLLERLEERPNEVLPVIANRCSHGCRM